MNQTINFNLNKNLLIKNILWSFLIRGFPVILAIICIPLIIKGLGIYKFGILTLIWTIIGYSTIFDFGLGRSLTQIISKKLGLNEVSDIYEIIWTSLIIVIIFGIITGILFYGVSPLILQVINADPLYKNDILKSIYLLAFSIPFLIGIVLLRGVLEAYQKFAAISFLRIPVIIFNFIVPILIFPFSTNLFIIVLFLVIGRIISFILHFMVCIKTVENFSLNISFKKHYIKPLLVFGGWMTVSNIITPVVINMDRFFISAILTASVVAYYTTSQSMIIYMEAIPMAIMAVMFPAFSTEFFRDKGRVKRLFAKSLRFTFLLIFLPALFIIIFAKPGLSLWIDPDFAQKSYYLTQVLAIGMMFIGTNYVPQSLIQAAGRADITAKIHLVEFPVYIVLLFLLLKHFGVVGAAYAWVIRGGIDFILLNFFAQKILKETVL